MRKRVVILASGAGSLTQAILDATELDIQIVAVVSDKSDAQVLERAKKANINTSVIELKGDRVAWDRQLFDQVHQYQPDLVISAGFMKILSSDFVSNFPTINSHPALLPDFPGAHAVRDALAAGVTTAFSSTLPELSGWLVRRSDFGSCQNAVEIFLAAAGLRPEMLGKAVKRF